MPDAEMPERSADSPAIVHAFLERVLDDRARGEERSVEEYQALFPGHEALIAREHARLGEMDPTLEGAPPRAPASVQRIGPYRILSVLGEGGMGVVYLAEQTGAISRRVALKVIKLGMDTREIIARFESERQALAMMSHSHIAKVFDAGATPDGRPYFVMEHVAGVPITAYCDQENLTNDERIDLFAQVCEGVQHAHQKGVIHRDIKPSNVLVTRDGDRAVVKIIDFGIARSLQKRLTENTFFTEHGQIIGTPEYMSPEQADASILDIDTRTDIYSLGVLLYQLIAGALPFDSAALRAAGYAEIQRRIREVEPPKPSTRLSSLGAESSRIAERRRTGLKSLLRELQGDLDWIVMKALEKNRARRYASASELAADLARHRRSEPVLAGPPTVRYRLERLVRRHRVALLATVLFLLVTLTTAVAVWTMVREKVRVAHIESSRQSLRHSALQANEYGERLERIDRASATWRESERSTRSWLPPWHPEMSALLEAGRALDSLRDAADEHYSAAVASAYAALLEAPESSPERELARTSLESLFHARHIDASGRGVAQLTEGFFRVAPSVSRGAPENVSIASSPAGARVHCFRLIESEHRRVPVAYRPGAEDPSVDLSSRLYLEVEAIHDPALFALEFEGESSLRVGDRILTVKRQAVRTRGDLATALAGVRVDEAVDVVVDRVGGSASLRWTPFPAGAAELPDENGYTSNPPLWQDSWQPGEIYSIYQQFGFTFAGSPLRLDATSLVGTTPIDALELPEGSWLLVLVADGHALARVPVVASEESQRIDVNLVREAPAGFVHVPAGSFRHGGPDARVRQQLPAGTTHLNSFFIARTELTVREWLEFLNHPATLARLDDRGTAAPLVDWRRPDLAGLVPTRESRVQLVPKVKVQRGEEGRVDTLILDRDAESSEWKSTRVTPLDAPMMGLSMLAGLEYARWRTERDASGWRYRLPSDLEWEKAARGVDGRLFVWGEEFIPAYTRCFKSSCRKYRTLGRAAVFPIDESVYGVRDLAGSLYEATVGVTVPGTRFASRRGGHWAAPDAYFFEIPTRNGRPPEMAADDCGVRLVADPPR